ncbi:WEB family [Trema orientale]|uniref:WEB family n=1 Tax=Trema orientale TaxID=63057 RepID=A0A2P5FY73_TREOI|nr:WEB family [Trema orientale]
MESPKTESFEQNYGHVGEKVILKIKKAELIKIKEELKKAKDNATQSWLDSRPLIDELERLKSGLARAQKRHAATANDTVMISGLQSELDTINASIESKKEEEVNATKMVNEMSRALDQLREEMDGLKRYTDEKRQSKLKLKRVLRFRRQRLRSFQLALGAARQEAEAYGASAAEAARYMDFFNSEIVIMESGCTDSATTTTTTNDHVQLGHEEYQALRRRAEEKDSIATWRVSVAEKERLAAESSRDLAMAKLKELKAGKSRLREREDRERKVDNNMSIGAREDQEEDDHENVIIKSEEQNNDDKGDIDVNVIPPPKAAKEDQIRSVRPRRSKTVNKKKKKKKNMVAKKESKSIFWQIKQCFLRNIIRKLFG